MKEIISRYFIAVGSYHNKMICLCGVSFYSVCVCACVFSFIYLLCVCARERNCALLRHIAVLASSFVSHMSAERRAQKGTGNKSLDTKKCGSIGQHNKQPTTFEIIAERRHKWNSSDGENGHRAFLSFGVCERARAFYDFVFFLLTRSGAFVDVRFRTLSTVSTRM